MTDFWVLFYVLCHGFTHENATSVLAALLTTKMLLGGAREVVCFHLGRVDFDDPFKMLKKMSGNWTCRKAIELGCRSAFDKMMYAERWDVLINALSGCRHSNVRYMLNQMLMRPDFPVLSTLIKLRKRRDLFHMILKSGKVVYSDEPAFRDMLATINNTDADLAQALIEVVQVSADKFPQEQNPKRRRLNFDK